MRRHTTIDENQVDLNTKLMWAMEMRREASRVSFLMCPFCVRGLLPEQATRPE